MHKKSFCIKSIKTSMCLVCFVDKLSNLKCIPKYRRIFDNEQNSNHIDTRQKGNEQNSNMVDTKKIGNE